MITSLCKKLNRTVSLILIVLILISMATVSSFAVGNNKRSNVIVSMGDSYSAGEGIDNFYHYNLDISDRVHNEDWLAHRSERSWPGRLKLDSVGTMSNNRDNNWYFVAASGAKTCDITNRQEKLYYKKTFLKTYSGAEYLPAQIDVFDTLDSKSQKADYVTLTLGGNDADFSGVITKVVTGVNYFDKSGLANKINDTWSEYYKDGGIRDNLKKTYELIKKRAGSQAEIIVAGYPKLLEPSGKGLFVSEKEATYVNSAVSNFNNSIEHLVNQCKKSGMKISFVSVEDAFKDHAAYSDKPFINEIMFGSKKQDLMDTDVYLVFKNDGSAKVEAPVASAYSMHPNDSGAQAYADCVQTKINELEASKKNTETSYISDSTKTNLSSSDRDIMLVLDTSGSMSGTPISETRKAAVKFVDTILDSNANIGIVTYNGSAKLKSDFSNNKSYLESVINDLDCGGSTNIDDGLSKADEKLSQSSAKKKIIVLMSDGMPNEGRTGDNLVNYAEELKQKGIYIYTLGFFEKTSDKTEPQALMEKIASEGCHYEVSDADSLVFFFGDIADQISGQKYIYVRIACPVDVSVTHNGETLNSSNYNQNTRTSFGTLTFEETDSQSENGSYYQDSGNSNNSGGIWGQNGSSGSSSLAGSETDSRVKILRLKEGEDYDIKINGNGFGTMNYSIGFMNENGDYSDFRRFNNISINSLTRIDTVAKVSDKTVLNVDENGDGKYDVTYEAKANSYGEIVDYSYVVYIIIGAVAVVVILILILIIRIKVKKRRRSVPAVQNQK